MKRRNLLGAGLAIAIASLFGLKPRDRGGIHNLYFENLSDGLKEKDIFKPSLVIELDHLDKNIENLKNYLNPNVDYRIVVKSLPSIDLLEYVMKGTQTNKLMVFHQPFLNIIAEKMPSSDVLLGKPMPIGAARNFYKNLAENTLFKADTQLQWLIDSTERLSQYLELAKKLNQKMRVNIEIDVGLHRGGLSNTNELIDILNIIENHKTYLEFSGLMGYDPHVAFVPSKEKAFANSQKTYQRFIDTVHQYNIVDDMSTLCLNGGGSPTIAFHKEKTVCNELAAGSGLVKPTDFDIKTLEKMIPASFIATPVLKKSTGTVLPTLEKLSVITELWNPNRQQTFFIYGGKWKADFVSPPGLIVNKLYGLSTNQQIVNGSKKIDINIDDFIFLRPHQSEFVFLQFEGLQVARNGKLVNEWPVFSSQTS